MLGKRPHQINRNASMSQLQGPPCTRLRSPHPPSPPSPAPLAPSQMAAVADSLPLAHEERPFVFNCVVTTDSSALCNYVRPVAMMEARGTAARDKICSRQLPIKHADALGASSLAHKVYELPRAPDLLLSKTSNFSSTSPAFGTKYAGSHSFLDSCYLCKLPLSHGRDIYMYRGDAAFCSEDCRSRQIARDEQKRKRTFQLSQDSKAGDITNSA
ncbi:hypothetical protein KP509_10G065800 [Ceratopteris richardii]|uniref:FLZ-type domain-containing protein n=1 Tax=Ceratopteris richardii TaxID=49495 RepID=A0A8T2TW10_CERRI|nr:hypothetical protein KP509_10G065800 [Ceratopteris richardii]